MNEGKLVCEQCGGDSITVMAWVDANTNEYKGTGPGEVSDQYCDNCDECVKFIKESLGIKVGDIGTVVHVYEGEQEAFEIEFKTMPCKSIVKTVIVKDKKSE